MPRKTKRVNIVTEEDLKNIDSVNSKLMDKFLKEKSKVSSPLTIDGYKSDLLIFFSWNYNRNRNKQFTNMKKIEFADFFTYATEELEWGSARYNRMRSALSSFATFIEKFYDDEYPTFRNIVLHSVENIPSVQRRQKTVLSEYQIEKLFTTLKSRGRVQQICWLALAIASGARFAELLRFTPDIIDEKRTAFDGLFLETSKPIKTKGRTREGKMLTKYIIKSIFLPHYNKWMELREEIQGGLMERNNSLFLKKDGSPAEESTVRAWMKEFEDILDVPIYPHCFRHYTTTYLSMAGLPAELIKELFGWESVDMVGVYDDSTAKDKHWKELEKLKKMLEKS